MPRNILAKRRLVRAELSMSVNGSSTSSTSSAADMTSPAKSNQEPTSSESSSDSGRESALLGEILSPSASFERPLSFRLIRASTSSTFSSSSSSDSLQLNTSSENRQSPSPVSPHNPIFKVKENGHLSTLPQILENLAVSKGIHPSADTGNFILPNCIPVSLNYCQTGQQLSPSPSLNASRNSVPLTNATDYHHYPQLNDVLSTVNVSNQPTGSSEEQIVPLLSPASRKRANSMGSNNNGEASSVAHAVSNSSVQNMPTHPKQRKLKSGRGVVSDDDFTTSPISGAIIKLDEPTDTAVQSDVIIVRRGDLDTSTNVVEVTEEAKNEIAKIDNRIGQYTCKLCKVIYPDAFALAAHNCPRIVHIEYQCPDCGKAFHCPANLASHRRWHKPKPKSVPTIPKSAKKFSLPPAYSEISGTNSSGASATEASPEVVVSHVPNMMSLPLKKRFFFGKSRLTTDGRSSKEELKSSVAKKNEPPTEKVKIASEMSGLVDKDQQLCTKLTHPVEATEKFQCQICHRIVYGHEHFVKHWQVCFLTANRNWTSFFFPSKR